MAITKAKQIKKNDIKKQKQAKSHLQRYLKVLSGSRVLENPLGDA